ncbi:MAG TPA: hypothetical protein EYQ14_25825 [Gammaproteobacteria bacterium]|nr:hypothetical protein [Gammaproteobacteria bacterium]
MTMKLYQNRVNYEVNSRVTFWGSRAFEPKMFLNYNHVATVDTDDLEEVFNICNFEVDCEGKLTRHAQMYSASVGDIIIDDEKRMHMIDMSGFGRVHLRMVPHLRQKVASTLKRVRNKTYLRMFKPEALK